MSGGRERGSGRHFLVLAHPLAVLPPGAPSSQRIHFKIGTKHNKGAVFEKVRANHVRVCASSVCHSRFCSASGPRRWRQYSVLHQQQYRFSALSRPLRREAASTPAPASIAFLRTASATVENLPFDTSRRSTTTIRNTVPCSTTSTRYWLPNSIRSPPASRSEPARSSRRALAARPCFTTTHTATASTQSGCSTHLNSNHFLLHVSGGFSYRVWRNFFVRPEAHYYHIFNNTNDFHSDNVLRLGASVGYTFHTD